jgi:hypothetical protein
MRNLLIVFATAITSLSASLQIWLGLALHVYTTWFAYHVSGWGAAILTFFTPPFSELFWIYDYYHFTGRFWSEIAIGSALYIALYPVLFVFAVLVSAAESK